MGISTGAMLLGGLGLGATAYSMHQQANMQQQALDQQAKSAAEAAASRPQASQAPGVQGVQAGMSGSGQAGGAPGIAQTFLTGSQGVDPNTLDIGKKTLLGS